MSRTFDKPVLIQRRTENGWEDFKSLRADVNKTGGGEKAESGARRFGQSLTFEVRYISALHEIFLDTQSFRIIYRGAIFHIEDYDDYMEKHITVKLEGVCSGERYDNG